MSGVVSHGPANLYDSSGNALVSLPIASSLGGGSSYVIAVAIVDQYGNQIVNFGSSGSTSALGTVAVSSGSITLSSAVTLGSGSVVAVSSGIITLSSGPQVSPSSVWTVSVSSATVTLSSNATVVLSSAVTLQPSSVGTPTSITASSSTQTLLSSNANRLGATIYNQSAESLYILLASTATPASTATFTLAMVGLSYYEVPYSYLGAITGLWSPSSGFARVTELS